MNRPAAVIAAVAVTLALGGCVTTDSAFLPGSHQRVGFVSYHQGDQVVTQVAMQARPGALYRPTGLAASPGLATALISAGGELGSAVLLPASRFSNVNSFGVVATGGNGGSATASAP